MDGELEQLRGVLDGLRAGVLRKVAGLDESQARRSTVDSGTSLAGLLQHLAFVESLWFERVVGGGVAVGERSMRVAEGTTLRELRTRYRAACARSDAVLASFDSAGTPVGDGAHDLRWALLSVIEETARHLGHADIVREQVDGRTGR